MELFRFSGFGSVFFFFVRSFCYALSFFVSFFVFSPFIFLVFFSFPFCFFFSCCFCTFLKKKKEKVYYASDNQSSFSQLSFFSDSFLYLFFLHLFSFFFLLSLYFSQKKKERENIHRTIVLFLSTAFLFPYFFFSSRKKILHSSGNGDMKSNIAAIFGTKFLLTMEEIKGTNENCL